MVSCGLLSSNACSRSSCIQKESSIPPGDDAPPAMTKTRAPCGTALTWWRSGCGCGCGWG
eukprot:scaffold100628_cov55-Phaeocystis_antarctica.AAC.2